MAKRRMLDTETVESDDFYELPPMAQTLYFHLNMNADDDGLIARTGNIMRLCNAAAEDLELLVERGWLIRFESGLFAIRHWKMHNYIPKDRYHPSRHKAEKSQLELDDSMRYRLLSPPMYTEGRIGEDRSGEDRSGEDRSGEVRSGQVSSGQDNTKGMVLYGRERAARENLCEEEETASLNAPASASVSKTTPTPASAPEAPPFSAPSLINILEFARDHGLPAAGSCSYFDHCHKLGWRDHAGNPIDWRKEIYHWFGKNEITSKENADSVG